MLSDTILAIARPDKGIMEKTRESFKTWNPAVTKSHRKVQEALLPIVACDNPQAAFQQVKLSRKWNDRVAASRSAVVLKLAKSLDIPSMMRFESLHKREKASAMTMGPAWLPIGQEQKIESGETMTSRHELEQFCWCIGHRLGDLLSLKVEDVYMIEGDWKMKEPSLAMLFVDTKTSGSIGPYTIHLPPAPSFCHNVLLKYLREAPGPYVFLRETHLLAEAKLSEAVRKKEEEIRSVQDLRSLRRGGLSTLKIHRYPNEAIRRLSQHKNDSTLEIYFGSGLLNFELKDQQSEMITLTERALHQKMPLPSITRALENLKSGKL